MHFFLPAPCLACDHPLDRTHDSFGLCDTCRRRLVPWPQTGCSVCRRLLQGAEIPPGFRCGRCRKAPPPYERLLSAWAYQDPLDATLRAFKFRRLEYLGGHLGRQLAHLFTDQIETCDLVVPVPLHWRRLWARGYNQAGVLARSLAAHTGLQYSTALSRRRPTPAQSRLHRRERKKNLADAFRLRRPVVGRRILLVDDIVTTGATIEAATRCLRRGGAQTVLALTVARTPDLQESDALKPIPS